MRILQVKVYQLPAWLLRRQFYNPIAYGRAMSRFCKNEMEKPSGSFVLELTVPFMPLRAYWRWNHKYQLPKHCGLTPMLQVGELNSSHS